MNERHVVYVRFRISDYHISMGLVLPDGRPNPLEDFKDIDGFERMLDEILARTPAHVAIKFRLGGDIIDFNAIKHDGSLRVVPTEEAARAELETFIRGNPRFIAALRRFACDSRVELEWEIGNHDLPLVWPSLQARLQEVLLVEGESWRLRFIYGAELQGKVLYIHGDQLDPFSANPKPKDVFITSELDRGPIVMAVLTLLVGGIVARGLIEGLRDLTFWRIGLVLAGMVAAFMLYGAVSHKVFFKKNGPDLRLLNLPYSSHLDAWVISMLKPWFPWYGRTAGHGHALAGGIDAIIAGRYAALMVPLVFVHMLYHRFFRDLVDARKKARIVASVRMMLSMVKPAKIERAIWKLLKKFPDAKWLVMGHFHAPKVWTVRHPSGREVVMIDDGTGIEQMRMALAEVRCRTPFTRIESFIRRVGYHWRHHPRIASGLTLLHLTIAAAPFGLNLLAGWKDGVFDFTVVSVSLAVLFARQAFALYVRERFTRFTLTEEQMFDDGHQRVRLLTFDQKAAPGTDPFSDYLDR